jgi:hypothetical protein
MRPEGEQWEGSLKANRHGWHNFQLTFPLFTFPLFPLRNEGDMSDRVLVGGVAAVAAILTLIQMLWMFGMFSPADALSGRDGAFYASALAVWFLITLAPLAAAAIILLMTRAQFRGKS